MSVVCLDAATTRHDTGSRVDLAWTDAELVGLACAGDERAWELIVRRHRPLVLGVAARHRLFGADALDVCQFVWTRLVEHAGRLREPDALRGWLATTASRACVEVLRARRRAVSVDPTGGEGMDRPARLAGRGWVVEPDHDAQLLCEERRDAVRAGMAELTGTQQQLLSLLAADPPLPYAEISRRLGLPLGSIGPTRARALGRLRRTAAVRQLLEELPAAA